MTRFVLPLVVGLLTAVPGFGYSFNEAVKSVEGHIEPAEARPGQTVTFRLTVKLADIYYTYPTRQSNKEVETSRNVIELPEGGDLIFVSAVTDPQPKSKTTTLGEVLYYTHEVTWEFKAVVSPNATPGPKQVALKQMKLLVCYKDGTDEGCLNPKWLKPPPSATVTVAGDKVEVEPQFRAKVDEVLGIKAAPGPPPPAPLRNDPPAPAGPRAEPKAGPEAELRAVTHRLSLDRDYSADLRAVQEQLPPPGEDHAGFWFFVGTAAVWGFITLLTPCVFPMIPITVSIFVKREEKQGTSALAHALVYALTIVVLMTFAALAFLALFKWLAVHPVTNVLLGGLFVTLALSLFGLFELTLPTWLADLTGNRAGSGGYVGTVFMAASFTIISFTCVAPFLGGFGGIASGPNPDYAKLAAGGLAFAMAFASPFFLLALFPKLIKKLPRSGDWMNMIKVSMGFLELAAALKFFRTAELRWLTPPAYFTYDLVLALWIAILGGMAFYLFGLFRTRHDHEMHDHVGPVRILFGLGALGLAVYLVPALFSAGSHDRNRPRGAVYAWVDSFLLPEPSAAEVVGSELAWSGDLRWALDDARGRDGRVFVDFTGITCTNCKLNERNVFVKPEIKDLFQRYTRVQLFTDTVPDGLYEHDPGLGRRNADAATNEKFGLDAFRLEQLPIYVILKPEPNGKTSVVGIYKEGLINNEAAFVQFLRDGLK